MATYKYKVYGWVHLGCTREVEADSEEEAIAKAELKFQDIDYDEMDWCDGDVDVEIIKEA